MPPLEIEVFLSEEKSVNPLKRNVTRDDKRRGEVEVVTNWRSIYAASVFYFLSSISMHAISANAYPYLGRLDKNRSEAWYGMCFGASKIGQASTLVLGSILTNRTQKYRVSFLVGRILCIAGLIAYGAASMFAVKNRKYLILCAFSLVGASEGALVLIRGYGPRFSSISDRVQAMSFITAAGLGGILFGPLINLIFSFFGNEDLFHFVIYWNMFTLPCIVLIILNIIALIFPFFMDEPTVVHRPNIRSDSSTKLGRSGIIDSCVHWASSLFDHIDIPLLAVLLFVKITSDGSIFAVLTTLAQHLAAVSNLEKPARVLVFSGGQIGAGLLSGAFTAVYSIFLSSKRMFQPTLSLIYSLVIFSGFALTSIPWPFANPVTLYNNVSTPNGCEIDTFKWCETTNLINLWFWFCFGCIFLGITMPLTLISQDTLYSRILEKSHRADLFQGLYGLVDCITLTIVPWKIGGFYSSFGPFTLYSIVAVILFVTCGLVAIFIPRFNRVIEEKGTRDARDIQWRYNNVPLEEISM